jgi:peptidoglycan/xylan/chitin deacetylase (PgdA/CDA1 family)
MSKKKPAEPSVEVPEDPVQATGEAVPDTDSAPAAARRHPWRWTALAAVLVAGVVLAYGPMPVSIDGAPAVVPRGATVASLQHGDWMSAPRGDLMSLRGRVLQEGAGGLPEVLVDGRSAARTEELRSGARLTVVRSPDLTEPTVSELVETTTPVTYTGEGPIESVEESGSPGIAEVVRGAVSGEESSRRVVSGGTAMIIRREPEWLGLKQVALTFDDGPWPVNTDAVLRILQAAGVKATFFMIGSRINRDPDIAKRVVAAGMEVEDHSQGHRLLARQKHSVVRKQIARGASTIRRVLAVEPAFFRPPGGSTNGYVRGETARQGLRFIKWTVDPKDWSRPGADKIVSRVLGHVVPGSVILMHDGGGDRMQTIAALTTIIDALKARGYTMVTLRHLQGLPEQGPAR